MISRTLRQIFKPWQSIAVAILLVFSATAAMAAVQEMRVVGVAVDNNSVAAEAIALEYAKKRAVFLAARKLGVKDTAKVVAKFTPDQWQEIVRGATVNQTRRDGYTTYIEANITIVPEALRRALKLPDGKPAEVEYDTRGVLLLSTLIGKDRAFMWEKDNILRDPISDEIMRQSRGTVLLPGGDLDDLRLIDYQNALTVKPDELKPMFDRYGAEEIIIAATKLSQPGTTDATNVLLRRLREDGMRNESLDIPVESAEETSDTRLHKAAAAIAGAVTQIATSTAERDARERAKAKKLMVRFAYRTPKDLAEMQDAVRAAPEVLYLDVPRIALARVTGTIYLKGDDQALRDNLIKQGVVVTIISDGWRLSMQQP